MATTLNITEEVIDLNITNQITTFSLTIEDNVGPIGPAGSDANVTNANVNLAIESNPSATRDSLDLGTAALADTGTGASNVILGNDSRLTDARTPTSHASSHVTGGTDKIRDASASQDGLMTTTFAAKLNGIEAGADVTDATNVNAAGAVMESDYSPAHSILVQQSGTGSPSSLSIGNNTLVGRLSGGGSAIDDLSASQVRTLLNVEDGADVTDAANVASVIHAATSKTTPVDADEFPITDSAASFGLKKLTFANLKTALNTLYVALTGNQTIAGNKTFSGNAAFTSTTRPTSSGTGTPLSSSILSYSDFANYIQQRVNTAILIPTFATARTSSGGSLIQGRGYSELSLLVTNSAAINLQFDACVLLQTSGESLSFNKRMIFCINIFEESLATNNQLFIQLGRNNFPATFSQLSEKGIGFGMSGSSLTPFVHNGSVLTSGSAVTKGTYSKIIMDFVPASGLYLYGLNYSTTAIDLLSSVTTNLPSGLENRSRGGLEIMHFNNGTGATGKVTFSNRQFTFF
jgi:hypothetical protein